MPLNYRRVNVYTGVVIVIVCCYAAYQTFWSQQGCKRICKQTVADATEAGPVQKGHDMYKVNPAVKDALFKTFKPLPQQVITGVEKFVIFVGNIKSGHTMIASLMDAHPNMVISNEYMLFHRFELLKNKMKLFNTLYESSWNESHHGKYSAFYSLSGHHYGVGIVSNFSWHGMYKNLKVIGDKCGAETVYVYQSDPSHFRKLLKQLSDTLQIQVMAVHVIRNPYDVIATNCFPSSMTSGINRPTEKNKFNDTNCLKKIVLRVIEVEDVVMSMKNDAELSLKILDIHNADYVKTPVETVKKICEFLEVDCPEGYL